LLLICELLTLHMITHTDEKFLKENFKEKPFAVGEYDNCVFEQCDLAGANFSGSIFIDCKFISSNLEAVKTGNTVFRDVLFQDCNLNSIQFEHSNKLGFTVTFVQSSLLQSSFFQMKLKKMKFSECKLQRTDFTESDLTDSVISGCDLENAIFEHTVLNGADLRQSYNYSIDPEKNQIRKGKFSLPAVVGLLDKYEILISH
jgi:fluoroquinolone resistance protein